jgi:hypothetical protein
MIKGPQIATYEAGRPICTSAAFLQLLQRLFYSGDHAFEIFWNMLECNLPFSLSPKAVYPRAKPI